ncbi:hypothetical protein AAE478_006119 [Parahypoxylon ruwenzoriense]
MASAKIRLATASPGTRATTKETITQLRHIANRAASNGADILLLPEAYLGGYPRGSDFGCKVGSRTSDGRDEYLRYFKSAVDLGDTVGDGAGAGEAWVRRQLAVDSGNGQVGTPARRGDGTREEIEQIARETGILILVGLVERAGGSLYCAVIYVCPKLGVIGKRRKVQPYYFLGDTGNGDSEHTGPIFITTQVAISRNRSSRSRSICISSISREERRREALTRNRTGTHIELPRMTDELQHAEGTALKETEPCWQLNRDSGTERLIWAQGSPATLKAVSTTIRGVRVNLAAAICWENYMPLLRQSLYAQNVNLYLAPTADGRDAWLPLIRTIALEGRCFVVSSNMCIRNDGATTGAATTTTATTNYPGGYRHEHRGWTNEGAGRRNSCLTEEGFEIALPASPTTAFGKPKSTSGGDSSSRGRRQSVFDEDGNEIALPDGEHHSTKAPSSSAVLEEDVERLKEGQGKRDENTTALALVAEPSTKLSSGFISRGGSSIVSPSGDVLAGPQWEDNEGIIYADVDFDDCVRGRLDLDAAGSYSRYVLLFFLKGSSSGITRATTRAVA